MPEYTESESWRKLVAGSMAGATSVFFTYPLDIIRARLAYAGLNNSNTAIHLLNPTKDLSAENTRLASPLWRRLLFGMTGEKPANNITLRSIVKDLDSVSSLYRGFIPTFMGIIPYAGVSFLSFEFLKTKCVNFRRKHVRSSTKSSGVSSNLPIPVKFMCGLLAGAAGQTVAYPFDVVRRQMQLDTLAKHIPIYKSVLEAILTILRGNGVRGIFTGLSINYVKVAPATAISFVTYEYLREKLGISL